MEQKDIDRFAELLKDAGYAGAHELIQEELIPLAQKEHISLYDAAREYANQDEEQDTSWFQLFDAKNMPIKNPKLQKFIERQIGKAEEEIKRADKELEKNKFDKGIMRLAKSWLHSQLVVKLASP